MTGDTRIRIIRHEAVSHTGSFEVRFADGRPSNFFYWDDIPERRVRSQQLDSNQAREEAITFGAKQAP